MSAIYEAYELVKESIRILEALEPSQKHGKRRLKLALRLLHSVAKDYEGYLRYHLGSKLHMFLLAVKVIPKLLLLRLLMRGGL